MVLHNTGEIFVAWKMEISLRTWADIEQQSLKADLFVFLSYELWIELLHRIWSGWNIISGADPYLLNLSFVSLILWALPSCFIVSGPKLWSRGEPRRAAQTFALVRDTQGDIGILRQPKQTRGYFFRGKVRRQTGYLQNSLSLLTWWETGNSHGCFHSKKTHLWEPGCCISVSNFINNVFIFFKESEQFELTFPLIQNNWKQNS